MTITELLPFLTQGTVLLITLLTLIDYLRHRGRTRLDVFLLFGDLALIVLFQILNLATEQRYPWLGLIGGMLLMAHPYLLLRLVQHLRPVPALVRWTAFVGLILSLSALAILPTPNPPAVSVALVLYFALVELYATGALVQGALTTRGVSHRRLLLAASGSALIATVISIAGVFAIAPASSRILGPFQQVIGLLSMICYYLGFTPPAWLRRAWQLAELRYFLAESTDRLRGSRIDETLKGLSAAAERAVGGLAAFVTLWDPVEGQFTLRAGSNLDLASGAILTGSPALERVWRTRQPVFLKIPAEYSFSSNGPGGSQRGNTLPTRLRAAHGLLAVPIATQEKPWGLLLVFLLGSPLFVSDDLSLLALFSQHTAVTLSYWELLSELEQRVAERTEQLQAAVSKLEGEVAVRKRTTEALRAAQERLQFLLDATPAVIYSIRATGDHRITFISENVSTQLGYEPHVFHEDPNFWLDHIHPEDLPAIQAELTGRFEREHGRFDYRFRRQDGQYRWIHDEFRLARDLAGNPVEIVGYWIDISTRKEAEQSVQQLNQDLQQRALELKTANQELEAFAYSVSHDLRAPLRAIDGFSRILVTRYAAELNEEARHYLSLVRENTQQMGQLIDDLLSFSRLSRQALNKQWIEPEGVVRLALRDLLKDQDGRQFEIQVESLPPCRADPSLLRQVFVNLLSNALKFTSTRPDPQIVVGCLDQNGEKVYFVRDNGVGFDMQYADKLFGVFQRLHLGDEFEGTGVGLAIVQRVINRHGGHIWAEAEVGRGATFYFTLPGSLSANPEPADLPAPAEQP